MGGCVFALTKISVPRWRIWCSTRHLLPLRDPQLFAARRAAGLLGSPRIFCLPAKRSSAVTPIVGSGGVFMAYKLRHRRARRWPCRAPDSGSQLRWSVVVVGRINMYYVHYTIPPEGTFNDSAGKYPEDGGLYVFYYDAQPSQGALTSKICPHRE